MHYLKINPQLNPTSFTVIHRTILKCIESGYRTAESLQTILIVFRPEQLIQGISDLIENGILLLSNQDAELFFTEDFVKLQYLHRIQVGYRVFPNSHQGCLDYRDSKTLLESCGIENIYLFTHAFLFRIEEMIHGEQSISTTPALVGAIPP